jgi:hypothetical protein
MCVCKTGNEKVGPIRRAFSASLPILNYQKTFHKYSIGTYYMQHLNSAPHLSLVKQLQGPLIYYIIAIADKINIIKFLFWMQHIS